MMKFTKIAEEIRTVRDFKKEPVENKKIRELLDIVQNSKGISEGRNSSILFVDNGKELSEKLMGKAGYYGKLIEAPHYLVITTKEFPGFMENSGYMMELLRLEAWEMGLATCWLSIENEAALKDALGIESQDRLTAFCAIGHQYKGVFKNDISPKSGRFGIEEIIYDKKWGTLCSVDLLEQRGFANIFYVTRYAPSWGNKQPWKFILDEDQVLLTIQKDKLINVALDAGIVMLYFEKAAHEEGIAGTWRVETKDLEKTLYAIPEEYEIIGSFKI